MKKNQEIAEVLYNIAELLELKGENTFKIRAYNKAARAVEGLSTDIEEIYAAEELESIPGVGSAIAGKIGERNPYRVNMTAVLEAAERTGTAMEINAHPSRLDLADVYVRKAKELGVKVTIDTDAHSSDGLDMMRFGVMVARRGWLEKEDVINALEADTLPFKQ